jgi:3-hydroxyacyl-[acyl-carrier-protein] dehydratase
MKFGLIDAIRELDRGERVVAVKAVSLAEEYLADHFPTFPVLPGVLMLEALAEAGAWLVRDALDFTPDVILLREARNVTYRSFVKPGQVLRVEVRCRRIEADASDFEGAGYCGEIEAVRGRFGLRHICLPSGDKTSGSIKERNREQMRARLALLRSMGTIGIGE